MRIQKSLYGFDEIDAAIRQASQADVDDAYRTAAAAQPGWAAQTPAERTAVLTRAADYVETHRDQLAALLSAESGSTAAKAGVELQLVVNSIREAATFPTRVHGKIMPSNTPGKENRVYREPVGVVGVISLWNSAATPRSSCSPTPMSISPPAPRSLRSSSTRGRSACRRTASSSKRPCTTRSSPASPRSSGT